MSSAGATRARGNHEAFTEQVFEEAPVIIAVLDLEGRIVRVNRFLEQLSGWSRDELTGESWVDRLVIEADRLHVAAALDAAGGGHASSEASCGLQVRSGGVRAVHWRSTTLSDDGGAPAQVLVVGQDVTEQGALERQLRYQGNLVENVSDALFSASLDHVVRTWNPAAERLFGWSRSEVVGCRWIDKVPFSPDSGDVAKMFAALREQGSWRGNGTQRSRDGVIAVSVSANLATDAGGERYAIYSIRDERHLRQLEAELRHAHKMEAIGRLASGIAHDFNNLLMGIIGCADIAMSRLPPVSGAASFLEEIKRAASGGAGITRQLLAFSRRRELRTARFDLGKAVQAWAEMLRRLLGEDIALRIHAGDEPLWINYDRDQIEQILMNLAVNARDAMPGGGELSIELSREDRDGGPGGLAPGEYVVLVVADTGCGMDEATRQRLFEPFYTTKRTGEGTGLGLSMVYGIVKNAGGHVACHSRMGEGATFTVHLPATEPGPEDLTPLPQLGAPAGEGRTALVVEDESLVRLTCRHYLADLGFEVLEASCGAEALRLARERRGQVALVVTDVVLPDAHGPTLATQLHQLNPSAAVVFMSAHTHDQLVRSGHLTKDQPALHKPFSRDELHRLVVEVVR